MVFDQWKGVVEPAFCEEHVGGSWVEFEEFEELRFVRFVGLIDQEREDAFPCGVGIGIAI